MLDLEESFQEYILLYENYIHTKVK